MKIAVVGSGISGLASAWLLGKRFAVTVFEADARLGGHTDTHDIQLDGRDHRIDTGFIVFNDAHYPLLTRLFAELGVASKPTTMSFAVRNERSDLEYNATDLNGLFCQRRNLWSPAFWGMLIDLKRFYREAPALLIAAGDGPTLGDFLQLGKYGKMFREDHLIPMASALWSAPEKQILDFPARHLVQFMANHQMLSLGERHPWRVVQDGSATYIEAMRKHNRFACQTASKVERIRRTPNGVELQVRGQTLAFDAVVLAGHADDMLSLLEDADAREREVLGAFTFQDNDTVLHTDESQLPKSRKAWAAWNVLRDGLDEHSCSVSYCMNLLQGIESKHTFVVSLNRTSRIDPAKILVRRRYRHPQYSHRSVAAQTRKNEIQGHRHTFFAGAYWGWGFHEDGMRSALDVAQRLRAPW